MKKLNEKMYASRYHHYHNKASEHKSVTAFKGSQRKVIAGVRVSQDLDPDSVFFVGESETLSDSLIASVLGEARSRPAVDDDRLGAEYNFSRRSTNFATGPTGFKRLRKYFDRTSTAKGVSSKTNIKHLFGEGFKDGKTHFRNVHLIPALVNQSMLAHDALTSEEPTHPGIKLLSKEQLTTIRDQSMREALRHIHDLTHEIDKHCTNRLDKLSHGPVIKNPMAYVSGDPNDVSNNGEFLFTHDALDHGISGALPSKFGEFVAAHMSELRNLHHLRRQPGHELNPETDAEKAKLRFENSKTSLKNSTMDELTQFYTGVGMQLGPHDLSNHDQLMKISKDRKHWGNHMAFLQNGNHPMGIVAPLRGPNPDQTPGRREQYLIGGRY